MECWRCGNPRAAIEPPKSGFRRRSRIAGAVTIPNPDVCHAFSRRPNFI
jgi:hypothetical protein